jgi:cob(I)alamin adenosyltransferase
LALLEGSLQQKICRRQRTVSDSIRPIKGNNDERQKTIDIIREQFHAEKNSLLAVQNELNNQITLLSTEQNIENRYQSLLVILSVVYEFLVQQRGKLLNLTMMATLSIISGAVQKADFDRFNAMIFDINNSLFEIQDELNTNHQFTLQLLEAVNPPTEEEITKITDQLRIIERKITTMYARIDYVWHEVTRTIDQSVLYTSNTNILLDDKG